MKDPAVIDAIKTETLRFLETQIAEPWAALQSYAIEQATFLRDAQENGVQQAIALGTAMSKVLNYGKATEVSGPSDPAAHGQRLKAHEAQFMNYMERMHKEREAYQGLSARLISESFAFHTALLADERYETFIATLGERYPEIHPNDIQKIASWSIGRAMREIAHAINPGTVMLPDDAPQWTTRAISAQGVGRPLQ